jgi:hypothetical protein
MVKSRPIKAAPGWFMEPDAQTPNRAGHRAFPLIGGTGDTKGTMHRRGVARRRNRIFIQAALN